MKIKDIVGIILDTMGAYTGAYICTHVGCKCMNDDTILKVVRGITGGFVGGALTKFMVDYISNATTLEIQWNKKNQPEEVKEESDE